MQQKEIAGCIRRSQPKKISQRKKKWFRMQIAQYRQNCRFFFKRKLCAIKKMKRDGETQAKGHTVLEGNMRIQTRMKC